MKNREMEQNRRQEELYCQLFITMKNGKTNRITKKKMR